MERPGSKIEELADFIKDKRNLHHEIRKLVTSIATAYRLANKLPGISASATRTTLGLTKKLQPPLATPGKPAQWGKDNNKKRQLSTPSPSLGIDKPAQKKTAREDALTKVTQQKKKKETKQEPAAESTEAQNQPSKGGFKKTRRKKIRSKAVLVQPAEE